MTPDQPQDSGQPVPKPPGGEVERFEFECSFRGLALAVDHPEGRWVRYEDYEKLKEELLEMAGKNADLWIERNDLKKQLKRAMETIDELNQNWIDENI